MLACLDVYYHDPNATATAAAVTFRDWPDATPVEEKVVQVSAVAPYEPGKFYLRELPCLLAVLGAIPPVEIVIIDGYVWLDASSKPGLGAHLYEALDRKIAVVGVAKTKFHGADGAREITRGSSGTPLFITAAGIPLETAADGIRSMHGKFRIPSLLSRVDDLSRHPTTPPAPSPRAC